MKNYKVKQVIELLLSDGWRLDRTKGDHRQFVNDAKPGTVTVSGKMSDDLSQFLLNSIWKQAGWKRDK
jgi:predicted RNA binding protein YcfA (HicA-like mRNA interferase family)